jgi:hypothetical protein
MRWLLGLLKGREQKDRPNTLPDFDKEGFMALLEQEVLPEDAYLLTRHPQPHEIVLKASEIPKPTTDLMSGHR